MSDAHAEREPEEREPEESIPLGDNAPGEERAYEQATPPRQPATSAEPEPDLEPPDAG